MRGLLTASVLVSCVLIHAITAAPLRPAGTKTAGTFLDSPDVTDGREPVAQSLPRVSPDEATAYFDSHAAFFWNTEFAINNQCGTWTQNGYLNFGRSLVVGDIDGNGTQELLVGHPNAYNDARFQETGAVLVYTPSDDTMRLMLTIWGIEYDDLFSLTGLACGDINDDNVDDIIISADFSEGYGNLTDGAGEVYVLFGRASWPAEYDLGISLPDVVFYGQQTSGGTHHCQLGTSIAIGDINGDSINDLVLGSVSSDVPDLGRADVGGAWVYKGASTWPDTIFVDSTYWLWIQGADSADAIYWSYPDSSVFYKTTDGLAVGDFNRDGFDDICMIVPGGDGPGNTRPHAGEARIVYGAATFADSTIDLATSTDLTIYAGNSHDVFYQANELDVDNNGFPDLVFSARFADGPSESRMDCGELYIIRDNPSLPAVIDLGAGDADVTLYAADENDRMEDAVIADINSDGHNELYFSSYRADGYLNAKPNCGEIGVFNRPDTLSGEIDLNAVQQDVIIEGAQAGSLIGVFDIVSGHFIGGDSVKDLVVWPDEGGFQIFNLAALLTGDSDFDLVPGFCDNCLATYNPQQQDSDFDGDGDACDIIFTTTPSADTVPVFQLVQADFDMDNRPDFVFSGKNEGDSLWMVYGKPDGTIEPRLALAPLVNAALAVGYINGDTLLDIATRTSTGTYIFLNNGSRSFTPAGPFLSARLYLDAGSLPAIAAGFFDGDAYLDLAFTPGTIAFGNGSGFYSNQQALPFSSIAVGAADLNSDFSDDLIAVVGDSAIFYLNDGSANFSRTDASFLAYNSFDAAYLLAGVDFNGDGYSDAAVLTTTQDSLNDTCSVKILLGSGAGTVAATDTFSINGLASAMVCTDIDRDNDLDLSFINGLSSRIEIYLGSGIGTFPDSVSTALGGGTAFFSALATGDLDRDGNPDFVSGGDSAAVTIATNNLPPNAILPDEMVSTSQSGWDLTVTNPQGFVISRQQQTVAGSAWWQTDVNGDHLRDVRTFDYNLQHGEYRFEIDTTPIVGGPIELDIRMDGTHYIAVFDDYHGYFARARSASAFDSLVFYYTVEATPSMNPPNGVRVNKLQPVFRWSKLMDSTLSSYDFQLDEDFFFRSPLLDLVATSAHLPCPIVLDTGSLYYWRVRPSGGEWSRTMVANIGAGCCVNPTGNVNSSGIVDGGDLALLVAYLTNVPAQKPTLPCPDEANVNATGIVDGGDLALLVAYLTNAVGSKPTLPNCP